MALSEMLVHIWQQSLVDGLLEVETSEGRYRVDRTRAQRLRFVAFSYQGQTIEAIEQNPNTSSRWAKLAQEGQRIMQFKAKGRYFANVCEGRLTRYPSWRSLGLPD